VQTVGVRSFNTQIVTDGYVAANGGGAANSLPVLPGQASDMLQAENDLASAQVQYRNAAAAEDRQHKLYQSEGAALKDWQQSQSDLATAASALASAKNRLRIMGKSDKRKLGAFVVGDSSTVWLIANIREADASLVHMGDPLRASVAALPGLMTGQVGFISSVIDPTTHRLAIGARIANPGGLLKPNMLATLTVSAGVAHSAPAIPQAGVIYDGDKAHVWIVGTGNALSSRAVTLGRVADGYIEVTSGLRAGEQVATAGGLFIDQATSGD
jgi:cobalt-zinc-cadmium efflux system membrane fusion protein